MAATGPTTWTVGGQPYEINSTYYLVIEGEGQYVVEWLLPPGTAIPTDDVTAEQLAMPLMRHVVRTGQHRRHRISKLGAGSVDVEWVGVALMRSEGVRTRGYRVRRRVDELSAAPP